MKYRKFGKTGEEVSVLGFGCMRFRTLSDGTTVDEDEAVRLVRAGIDGGINYVDTAWPYHNGESERILGKALQDGYRAKTHIATKSPVWFIKEPKDFDYYLDEQLKRLDTDHVDFYLFHALSEKLWENVKKLDLLSRMEAARDAGKIRHIGFSFHDTHDVFLSILDGFDWEFCQIQMNYVDIEHQAGMEGLEEVGRRGMGLVIMEPLLGGQLAALKSGPKGQMSNKKEEVEWGFDFLWNHPEVSTALSGMNTMGQLESNLLYASRAEPGMLSPEDKDMLLRVRQAFKEMTIAACTSCEYCLPCPAGIEIPLVLRSLNQSATLDVKQAKAFYDRMVVNGATSCLHCGSCEKKCPQHLTISDHMSNVAEMFKR